MAIPFILFVIIVVLCFFAYCDNCERAKKKRELEEERQWAEKRRQQELEWEREAKQRQIEQEALLQQMKHEEEMSKQLAAERSAEPMIINLTITERDANGLEIGDPKPLSVKIALDNETASRLMSILRG
ncbi:MAG: hypothetical protein WCJ37_16710 [Syntrophus sp. (in: bacteria)]